MTTRRLSVRVQWAYSAAGTCSSGLRASLTMQMTCERSSTRHSCRHTSRLCSNGESTAGSKRAWISSSHRRKCAVSASSCAAMSPTRPCQSGRSGKPSEPSCGTAATGSRGACSASGSVARSRRCATDSSVSRTNAVDSALTAPLRDTCCIIFRSPSAAAGAAAGARSSEACARCLTLSRWRCSLSSALFCLPERPFLRCTIVVDDSRSRAHLSVC